MRVFPAFVPLVVAVAASGAAAQTAAPAPTAPAPRYQAFDLGTHHRAVSTSNTPWTVALPLP